MSLVNSKTTGLKMYNSQIKHGKNTIKTKQINTKCLFAKHFTNKKSFCCLCVCVCGIQQIN